MKELIIKEFDIKPFWHSFDIWILTFEIVPIPNYLSIQVTGKKNFVKPFFTPLRRNGIFPTPLQKYIYPPDEKHAAPPPVCFWSRR